MSLNLQSQTASDGDLPDTRCGPQPGSQEGNAPLDAHTSLLLFLPSSHPPQCSLVLGS